MPDVTICLTSEEVAAKLKALPGVQPTDRMGGGTGILLRIQPPDDQSPYVRMKLWRFYDRLALNIGEVGPLTPSEMFSLLVLAGSGHSERNGLDDATVRELQAHIREVLIPTLIDDEAAKAEVLRRWNDYFGISPEGSS